MDAEINALNKLHGSAITMIPLNEEEQQNSKRRLCKVFLGGFLLAAFAAGVIMITVSVLNNKPSNDLNSHGKNADQTSANHQNSAKRDAVPNLLIFLQKVQTAYFAAYPYKIITKPGVTNAEIRAVFKPYDPRPSALKHTTDVASRLKRELDSHFTPLVEGMLSNRELKGLYEARFFLRHFNSNPYETDYYAGDFMLGPNIFSWQPSGSLFMWLQYTGDHLKPRTFGEVVEFLGTLRKYKDTVLGLKENMKLGVKAGMVRSREACKAGLDVYKKNNWHIVTYGAKGILRTNVGKKFLSPDFLVQLAPQVYQDWFQQHGKTIAQSIQDSLVDFLGKPVVEYIKYMENEHSIHCVPSHLSSGLATLPLAHVCRNGVADLSLPTTGRLPSGESLNGSRAYHSILSFFTTTNVTPRAISDMGWARLKELKKQAVSIAKQVTGEIDEDVAVSKFRTKLSSRAMFFNSKPFPANESDENAFSVCSTEASAQRYCPQRWKAYEVWKSSAGHIYQSLRSKIPSLFYTSGSKKTTPTYTVTVVPDFNPTSSYHSYNSRKHRLPFFMDDFGPIFAEWSTTAHETEPGHHLEVDGYYDNFIDTNNDAISWLGETTFISGFTEGWATYAETPLVAVDIDAYKNDLMSRYGMLQQQIMNALRLVIETGLHSFGMDRTTAIRLFDEYAWDSSDLASKEVTRYQSMMGQGVSYMIGQNAFKNARKYAEDKLGSRFSIREFHYQVLHQGELTFDYLEKYVQHYVRGKLSTCCTPRDESAEAKRQRRTIGRHWRRHAKRLPRDPWRGVVHT
ncbi:uncharacterized protein LOC5520476 [Nematostella vectensis]|uniref:uncharacterized protein LOC5520476 n=1 Tax=Nematostella vectensis TaxID=45351 RepID=UPI002076E52F|nr:uncharacterized protein LOC5520476 [Nematostella vectensis]